MIWYFEKINETNDIITYLYSRESKSLDGRIHYNKKTGKSVVSMPCEKDKGNKEYETDAIIKFTVRVVEEGFPQKRCVVTG